MKYKLTALAVLVTVCLALGFVSAATAGAATRQTCTGPFSDGLATGETLSWPDQVGPVVINPFTGEQAYLTMGKGGDLLEYEQDNSYSAPHLVWSTQLATHGDYYAEMESKNLVIIDPATGKTVWSTNINPSSTQGGDYVELGADFKLGVVDCQTGKELWSNHAFYDLGEWTDYASDGYEVPQMTLYLTSEDWWGNVTVGTQWLRPYCDIALPAALFWSCDKYTANSYDHIVNGHLFHTDWYHQDIGTPIGVKGTKADMHLCEYMAIHYEIPQPNDPPGHPITDQSAHLKFPWQSCG